MRASFPGDTSFLVMTFVLDESGQKKSQFNPFLERERAKFGLNYNGLCVLFLIRQII